MPRIRVLPYKIGSRSAKALADALGGKVLKLEGSRFVQRPDDIIINWGSSNLERRYRGVFNLPTDVAEASDKLRFFREMGEQEWMPSFWERAEDIPDDAFPIVCRTILNGHSGAGIVIANTRDELVPCRLYVQYKKKKHEYRIHLGWTEGRGIVQIDAQKKVIPAGTEPLNTQVRNHGNGYIYARENIVIPNSVMSVARQCFEELSLDFCAVDVIYNEYYDKAYVLEVNTAPGLEGQTVENYSRFFNLLINSI